MKKIATLLLTCIALSGQSQSYFVNPVPYNPMPFDSGINVVTYVDDTWSPAIPIGFDFYFFGQPYQSLVLGTNGLVSFDLSLANEYCQWPINDAIPTPLNPTNSIMFPYQDLDPSMGGLVHHQVYGAPPNRKFVLSFDTVPYYLCNDSTFTGQLILYEASGDVEMQLHHKTLCDAWNGGASILGIQNASGTVAYWASNYNYPTQWTADNEAWIFTSDSDYTSNMNRISGRIFADPDQDCTFGGTDYPLTNKPVIFDNGLGNLQYSFTDMQGYFSKLVLPGTYTFTTSNIANQYYASNCPPGGTYSVNFPGYNDSSDNNLFADTIVNFCSEVSLSLWAHGETAVEPLGVCDTGYVEITLQNAGTLDDSATIVLTLNDSTQILYSPVAYTSLGNNEYQFAGMAIAAGGSVALTVMIRAGCDTIGTVYCFSALATTIEYDCQPYNNADAICVPIGVPFDPNAIYVSSLYDNPAAGLTDYLVTTASDNLSYNITFQNTGTDIAHDVTIKLLINTKLNPATITPAISSHAYNWLLLGDTLIFVFNGIELPDSNMNEAASHGFIRFMVQQMPNNLPGMLFAQRAGIYFDYLSPVTTNDAIVEIENPESVPSVTTSLSGVMIYPNPVTDQFTITAPANARYVVSDLAGKLIASGNILHKGTVDASVWPTGLYLISVRTDNGLEVRKVVKE